MLRHLNRAGGVKVYFDKLSTSLAVRTSVHTETPIGLFGISRGAGGAVMRCPERSRRDARRLRALAGFLVTLAFYPADMLRQAQHKCGRTSISMMSESSLPGNGTKASPQCEQHFSPCGRSRSSSFTGRCGRGVRACPFAPDCAPRFLFFFSASPGPVRSIPVFTSISSAQVSRSFYHTVSGSGRGFLLAPRPTLFPIQLCVVVHGHAAFSSTRLPI